MDRMINLSKSLSSGSPGEQKIALALITREKQRHPDLIPDEILAVALPEVIEVATNSKNQQVADQAKQVAVDLSANTNLAQQVKASMENIPPRIYIQIPDENLRDEARQIKSQLEGLNYIVPGIEKVRLSQGSTQVKYFKTAEASEAKQIAEQLRSLGVSDAREIYISGFEDSKSMRPRHYEIWFGPGTFSNRTISPPTPK